MEEFDINILKSGTDIRGVAVQGKEEITLTDEIVGKIAKGFAEFLRCKINKKQLSIAVGHDSRVSAERIKKRVIKSLTENGVFVYDTGLSSTPAMFMITQDESLHCDGSIMITASHHPMDKNGMKFFTSFGGVEGKDITEILRLSIIDNFEYGVGKVRKIDYMKTYSQILVDKVRVACGEEKPLSPFHIVVDAGNGAGGFYAYDVLKPLGANIDGSQFLEPDGTFPNHIPNPENKVAMDSIASCVIKNKADLGLIFDTDVDRAAIVSSSGEEINRNRLIALISAVLLKENKGASIVTDSITSIGLKQFIKENGGNQYSFKRGYRNVINEAIRLNKEGIFTPLAIETSGHAALKENYFLDDGAYLVTKLIIEMAKLHKENKKLDDLISSLKEPKEEVEIRMGFFDKDFASYGKVVLQDFLEFVKTKDGLSLELPNYEGVRVNFDDKHGNGWLLMRMSLHDPIMPLNIESEEKGGTKEIAIILYGFLIRYNGIDVKNLEDYIK